MTFIKLNTDNFVFNTLKSTFESIFDKSDKKTWVSTSEDYSGRVLKGLSIGDKTDLLSKIRISNPESSFLRLDLDVPEDVLVYKKISFLFSIINKKDLNIDEYEGLKTEVSNYLGVTKDKLLEDLSIKSIKDLRSIEYIKPRFLINDSFVFKKNAIKNSLYEKYRQSLNGERLINPDFGFCNYNSLNFTSVLTKNKNHSNIIIYENRFNGSNKNKYDFINQNNFSYQSRIIFRKSKDIEKPGCILHIPGIINVFVVKTPLKDTGRLVISLGSYTQKNIFYEYASRGDNVDKNFININYVKKQENNSTYISSECLKENYWHTIFLQVDKNNKSIEIFIDGEKFDEFKFNENIEKQSNNSYICFGNTINYFNNKTSTEITDIDKCFHFIFNELSQENKFINIYDSQEKIIEYYNIKNLIEEDFEINITDNSFCFIGEMSDIRFYKSKFFKEDIKRFNLEYISSLDDENLDFCVPVMYVPKLSGKKGIICPNGREENIAYSLYYNPYFSSFGGGLETNVENFLVEFKKNNTPNIVICGKSPVNFYIDNTAAGFSEVFNKSEYRDKINEGLKLGKSINELYCEIHNENSGTFDLEDNFNILAFKNSFILPNDNGIPFVDFSIIDNFITKVLDYKSNTAVENIKSNVINTKEILLNYKEHKIKNYINSYKVFNNLKDEFFLIEVNKDIYEKYTFTSDILSDISNIIYYDKRFKNLEEFYSFLVSNNTLDLHSEMIDIINRIEGLLSLHERKTNPVTRLKLDDFDFDLEKNTDTLFKKEIIYNENIILYNPLNISYNNITSDYDSFFISIIDIPSCFYNNKLDKDSIEIKLPFKVNYLNTDFIKLKDDGLSSLYRADCLSKIAKWNYVGHIFYNEGIAIIHNPVFTNVDQKNFTFTSSSESSINTNEVNIPLDYGEKNFSTNNTYDSKLRIDDSAINFEESFVYITDVYLHDDRFNLLCKTKLAKPIAKKDSDRFLIRVKCDF